MVKPHACHHWGFCGAHLPPTRNTMLPTESTLEILWVSLENCHPLSQGYDFN